MRKAILILFAMASVAAGQDMREGIAAWRGGWAMRPRTFVVGRERVDLIRGVSQDEDTRPLGYFVGGGGEIVGTGGASGDRRSTLSIFAFDLPTLPRGQEIASVTLHYHINGYRNHTGLNENDFDAHTYVLDTDDPTGSHLDFYFSEDSDPNPSTIFIGAAGLGIVSDGNTSDVSVNQAFETQFTGAALGWFQSMYTGIAPSQNQVFIRFNRSKNPDQSDLGGSSLSRFTMSTTSGETYLVITTRRIGEPWTPDYADLDAWWDFSLESTVTTNSSGNIISVADITGNEHTLEQGAGTRQPSYQIGGINGLNCALFDTDWFGANSLADGTVDNQPLSVYAVYNSSVDDGNSRMLWSFGAADPDNSRIALVATALVGTHRYQFFPGTVHERDGVFLTPTITSLVADSSIVNAFINGSNVLLNANRQATDTQSFENFRVGAYRNQNMFSGRVGEFLIFKGTHSTDTREKIEGYLAHKWGLTDSLPSDHPYKYNHPTK